MAEMRDATGAPVPYVTGSATEPLRGRALYVSLAGALVGAAVTFGLPLDDAQQATVASLAAIVLAILAPQVTAWWARRHVNSPNTMRKVLAAQRAALSDPLR